MRTSSFFAASAVFAALLVAAPVQAAFNPQGPASGGGSGSTASVTVVTNVVNDDGGSLLPASFLMTYGDGVSVLSSFAGTASPGMHLTVSPGSYQVQGPDQAGYARTYGAGCSGTLAKDDSATCIVTYDDIAPADCEATDAGCGDPAPPTGPEGGSDCAITDAGCGTTTPPGGPVTPPGGSGTSTPPVPESGELPRTGGSTLPEAAALAATGVALSFRKRS